jgi:ferritin-like metal-binding protein YciE
MKERHTTKQTASGARPAAQGGTKEIRDEIIDWLRDAYAMERGLESALEKQAKSDELSAGVRDMAATHLEETRRHAEAVRALLQSMGTDTSSLKTGFGVIAESTKGLASVFARDERIKDLLDAYSMEHFEIACYTALAAAAERAGLAEVARTCRQIIPDEERMARAIMTSLPNEVATYLFEAETART